MRAHPCLEHGVPARQRHRPEAGFLPELRAVPEVFVAAPDVVDEDVQWPMVRRDPREERLHLVVITMVAAHRDALAAELLDILYGLMDGAGQLPHAGSLINGAAGDVDGGAGFRQSERHTLSHAAACSRDQGDFPAQGCRLHAAHLSKPTGTPLAPD